MTIVKAGRSLQARIKSCRRCPLREGCTMPIPGLGRRGQQGGVMYVGEAPGVTEDREGKPFIGRAGEVLSAMVNTLGLKRKDIYITNAVKCLPPLTPTGGHTPNKAAIEACRYWLKKEIAAKKPEVIVPLGNVAMWSVLEDYSLRIMRNHGKQLSRRGVPVIPTFHPSFLMRTSSGSARKPGNYLQQAVEDLSLAHKLAEGLPEVKLKDVRKLLRIKDYTRGMEPLNGRWLGFDFEGPLMKPFSEDADILCGSISCGRDVVYFPPDKIKHFLAYFLKCKGTFVGHAISNDLLWMLIHLCKNTSEERAVLRRHYLDSMIACAIHDHRIAPKTLKYLGERYARLALVQRPFGGQTGLDLNEVPADVMRVYNCSDSYGGVAVAKHFLKRLSPQKRRLVEWLSLEVLPATVSATYFGMKINKRRLKEVTLLFKKRWDRATKQLEGMAPDVDLESSNAILKHVFSTLGLPILRYTDKQRWAKGKKPDWCRNEKKPKFDKEIKERLKKHDESGFIRALVRRDKARKRHQTYAVGFKNLIAPDGRIHPRFVLVPQEVGTEDEDTASLRGGAVTGRLIMRDPAFQVIPRGDPIRDTIISVYMNGVLVCWDYSQIELRVGADQANCEVMLEIYEEGKLDIHRLTASELLGKKYKNVTDDERQDFGKTPNFSIIYKCQPAKLVMLFRKKGKSISMGFAAKMIDKWYNRYKNFREYQNDVEEFVIANGYVLSPTGRQEFIHANRETADGRRGLRMAVNMAIQSGASDICSAAFGRLGRELRRQSWYGKAVVKAQVYDSVVIDCQGRLVKKLEAMGTDILCDAKRLVGPLGWNLQCPITVECKRSETLP